MISQNAESEMIRTASFVSLSPLKTRLLGQGETAALVNSLFPLAIKTGISIADRSIF